MKSTIEGWIVAANLQANQNQETPEHLLLDTFRLVAETHRQADGIAKTASQAVRTSYSDPVLLAQFIENHQTPVYILPAGILGKLALWLLGCTPGFIPPVENPRYETLQRLLASLSWLVKRPAQSDGCHWEHGAFVVPGNLFTVGFISHQLHHWLAFRSGMQGYSDHSQTLYKKFWEEQQGVIGNEVYDMSVDDILALKAAINRDLEALEFLKRIAQEILIPVRQGRHFRSQGSASA